MSDDTQMMKPTINIIGAGLSGLTLARCLKNKGIPSIIFDKNPTPARLNYGISLHPWSYQPLLKVLNLDENAFRKKVAVDTANSGVGKLKGDQSVVRAHRGRLEGLLREGLDVQWGFSVEGVLMKGGVNMLLFKNGKEARSDLVVDSSGVHSQIRRALLPTAELNILPYVCFRGTRRLEGSVFKDVYERHFADGNVIQVKRGDILLQISVNDYRDGGEVDISYIYSRPSRIANDLLHRPDRKLKDASERSEAFFDEVSSLEGLDMPYKDAFDGQKIKGERILHWLMRDLVVGKDELMGLAAKGVVLVGDSAHALPILGAEGGNVAIRDGVGLAGYIEKEGGVGVGEFFEKRYVEWESEVRRGEERLRDMHASSKSTL